MSLRLISFFLALSICLSCEKQNAPPYDNMDENEISSGDSKTDDDSADRSPDDANDRVNLSTLEIDRTSENSIQTRFAVETEASDDTIKIESIDLDRFLALIDDESAGSSRFEKARLIAAETIVMKENDRTYRFPSSGIDIILPGDYLDELKISEDLTFAENISLNDLPRQTLPLTVQPSVLIPDGQFVQSILPLSTKPAVPLETQSDNSYFLTTSQLPEEPTIVPKFFTSSESVFITIILVKSGDNQFSIAKCRHNRYSDDLSSRDIHISCPLVGTVVSPTVAVISLEVSSDTFPDTTILDLPYVLLPDSIDLDNENHPPLYTGTNEYVLNNGSEAYIDLEFEDSDNDLLIVKLLDPPDFVRQEYDRIIISPENPADIDRLAINLLVRDNGTPSATTLFSLEIYGSSDQLPRLGNDSVALIDAPDELSNENSPIFTFNGKGVSYSCKLDLSTAQTCSSPYTLENLGDGSHVLLINAFDVGNGKIGEAYQYRWSIDSVKPKTTFVETPPELSTETGGVITFRAEQDAEFSCTLDEQKIPDCASPFRFSGLSSATHRLTVVATDKAGNVEEIPAVFVWRIDREPPKIYFTVTPDDQTNDRNPTFSFVSDKEQVDYQCSLDSSLPTLCHSPVVYFGLSDGTHKMIVFGQDSLGNINSVGLLFTWLIDTKAPVIEIDEKPPTVTSKNSVSITFHADEPVSKFICSYNQKVFPDCAETIVIENLPDSPNILLINATDQVGNMTDNPTVIEWTVDTSPPESGTVIVNDKNGTTNLKTPILTISSKDARFMRLALSEEGLVSAVWLPFASVFSGLDISSGGDGEKIIWVEFQDLAGNVQNIHSFGKTIYDTMPPPTGAIIVSDNEGYTNESKPFFTITCEDASMMRLALVEASLSQASWLPFSAEYSGLDISKNGNGLKTIWIEFKDQAGNVQTNHAYAETRYDDVPPTKGIVTVESNEGYINKATPAFDMTSDGADYFAYSMDALNLANVSFAPFAKRVDTIDISEGGNGVKTVWFVFKDKAGNIQNIQTSITFSYDTIPPDPGSISISDNFGYTKTAKPTILLDSGGADYIRLALDEIALIDAVKIPYSSNYNQFDIGSGGDGTKTIWVEFIDKAGNSQPVHRSVSTKYDTSAPVILLTQTPNAITSQTAVVYRFESEANVTFQCSYDLIAIEPCLSPVDLLNQPDGVHNFRISGTDLAGNISNPVTLHSFTIDTAPPSTGTVAIAGNNGYINNPNARIELGSDGADLMRFALSEGTLANQAWIPFSLQYSLFDLSVGGEGTRTLWVEFSDLAGNNQTSHAWTNYTYDTIPPETGTISIVGSPISINTAYPNLVIATTGADFFRLALLETGLATATRIPYTTNYSGFSIGSGAEGTKTIWIEFSDLAGNIQSNHPSTTIEYDTQAPQTTIDGSPEILTGQTVATFLFSSELGTTFACKLDLNPYLPCNSPYTTATLSQGAHTFFVKAKDLAGNEDATPANHQWTIDSVPPATGSIRISDTNGYTNQNNPGLNIDTTGAASMRFAVSEAGLNASPFVSYTATYNGFDISAGGEGLKTVWVEFKDQAGNIQTIHTSDTTTYDIQPPSLGVIAIEDNNGNTNQSSPNIAISSSGADLMRFALTEGGLSQASWVPFANSYNGFDISSGGDGEKTIWVELKDFAGNIQPVRPFDTVYYDGQPPETTLTNTPAQFTKSSSASFSFLSGANELYAVFQCELDQVGYAPCTSPISFSGLADGAHSFRVKAIDPAGNQDPSPALHNWSIDNTPPLTGSLTIVDRSGYTNDQTPLLNLSTDKADYMRFALVESGLLTANWVPYQSTYEDFSIVSGGDGQQSIYVEFKDEAQNIQQTHCFDTTIFDGTPPQNANILINDGDQTTDSAIVTITLGGEDNLGLNAMFLGEDNSAPPLDSQQWIGLGGGTVYSGIRAFSLSDNAGEKTVSLWFVDKAGNLSSQVSDTIIVPITFIENYHKTDDSGGSVIATSDHGYAIAGNSIESDLPEYAYYSDAWIIKTDEHGVIQWDRSIGSSYNYEIVTSIQQTSDGGFILTGKKYLANKRDDVLLIKMDETGAVNWTRFFDSTGYDDIGYSVRQTSDGGYIIVGSCDRSSWYQTDLWLIKTNSIGSLQWSKIYGGVENYEYDVGYDVAQTTDGGYIVTGYTYTNSFGSSDLWLIKTDAAGDVVWKRNDGGSDDDVGNAVIQTSDGGFLVAGKTLSNRTNGTSDVYLLKTNAGGTTEWLKYYGGATSNEAAEAILEAGDGHFVFSGYKFNSANNSYDLLLSKIDRLSQSQIWQRTYGSSTDQFGYDLARTFDGGFVVVGTNYIDSTLADDIYLVKTDSRGLIMAPDLTVTSINCDNPRGYYNLDCSIVVANQGTKNLSGLVDNVLLYSSDSTITLDDPIIGYCSFSDIDVATEKTIACNGTIPLGIAPGTVYFGIYLDSSEEILEINDSNNAKSQSFPIKRTFKKEYGDSYDQTGTALLFDNTYYRIAGSTRSIDGTNDDAFNMIVSESGYHYISDEYSSGLPGDDRFADMVFDVYNSNYSVAIGTSTSIATATTDISLTRLTWYASESWHKTYDVSRTTDVSDDNVGVSLIGLPSGDYFLLGNTIDSNGTSDIVLLKTSSTGTKYWHKLYGGTGNQHAAAVRVIDSATSIIVGTSDASGNDNIVLFKVDNNDGNTIWTKSMDDGGNEIAYDLVKTATGGFMILGSTDSVVGQNENIAVYEVDSTGSLLSSATYGGTGNDRGYKIAATSDGNYIITGFTTVTTFGRDVALLKIDEVANQIWMRNFGGSNEEIGTAVIEMSDGGYAVTGRTSSFGGGGSDIWLIKTDNYGHID